MTINITATAVLISQLHEDACCRIELAKATGMQAGSVRRWINIFHKKRLVYIAEWHKHDRVWVAYFAWNHFDASDVPKPKPMTSAQYDARYREKQRWKPTRRKEISDGTNL